MSMTEEQETPASEYETFKEMRGLRDGPFAPDDLYDGRQPEAAIYRVIHCANVLHADGWSEADAIRRIEELFEVRTLL